MPVKKGSTSSSANFRLYRSQTDRILGGVCGGIAETFGIDSTIVRLVFVLLFVFGGSGFLLYLILWIVIPSEGISSKDSFRYGADEIRAKAHEFAGKFKSADNDRRNWFGIIVLLFGIAILFNNFGFNLRLGDFWPILLIALGFLMIYKR